jgi:hypothetical protein
MKHIIIAIALSVSGVMACESSDMMYAKSVAQVDYFHLIPERIAELKSRLFQSDVRTPEYCALKTQIGKIYDTYHDGLLDADRIEEGMLFKKIIAHSKPSRIEYSYGDLLPMSTRVTSLLTEMFTTSVDTFLTVEDNAISSLETILFAMRDLKQKRAQYLQVPRAASMFVLRDRDDFLRSAFKYEMHEKIRLLQEAEDERKELAALEAAAKEKEACDVLAYSDDAYLDMKDHGRRKYELKKFGKNEMRQRFRSLKK